MGMTLLLLFSFMTIEFSRSGNSIVGLFSFMGKTDAGMTYSACMVVIGEMATCPLLIMV